jgi:hypothetical protein
MKAYIGADPGKNGGISLIVPTGAQVWKMPTTEKELFTLIHGISTSWGSCFALVEIVHSSPQMGVKSAFSFGQGYGALRMAFIAAGIPFEGVRPQQWQKELGCLSGGDKNKTKSRAQSLFPNLPIFHWSADALLIGEYARRKQL